MKIRSILWQATLFASCIALDQFAKYLARTQIAIGEKRAVLGPFALTHFENNAGPLSLPIHQAILITVSVGVLIACGIAFWKKPMYRLALTLIVSGGISNLFDRVTRSATIDYLALPFGGYYNFADFFILAGIITLTRGLYTSDPLTNKK